MDSVERCERCGHALELVRNPVRQLRWSGYWMEGLKSLLTGPLKMCSRCGAIYSTDGKLLAAGAVETQSERRLDVYRKDMAYLRDSFAGVVVAGELAALWLFFSSPEANVLQIVLAGAIGATALIPFGYFGRKAKLAKRDLKKLRESRRQGLIPTENEQ